jgi:hypothetical protein
MFLSWIKAKQPKITFSIAIIACLVALTTMMVSTILSRMFGLIPGYGTFNFWFHVIFFFPFIFLSFLVSLVTFLITLFDWHKLSNTTIRWFTVLFSLPGIINGIYWLVHVLRMMR